MIIHTHNESVAALVAPYGLRTADDDHAFVMAPATVQQLDRLCTVLTTDHAGQWSVNFDGAQAGLSYEDLTEGVDGEHWQAMMLAPGAIGADSEDLIFWLEEVYGQPVTTNNYKRSMQLFRYWYAATHPDEYHNPPGAQPAKYARLSLGVSPEQRKEKSRKDQAKRNQRIKTAVERLGCDTIDQLVGAVLALSDEQAAQIKALVAS